MVERGDRAFPASHNAGDVVDTLLRACTLAGVKVVTDCEVKTIDAVKNGRVLLLSQGRVPSFRHF